MRLCLLSAAAFLSGAAAATAPDASAAAPEAAAEAAEPPPPPGAAAKPAAASARRRFVGLSLLQDEPLEVFPEEADNAEAAEHYLGEAAYLQLNRFQLVHLLRSEKKKHRRLLYATRLVALLSYLLVACVVLLLAHGTPQGVAEAFSDILRRRRAKRRIEDLEFEVKILREALHKDRMAEAAAAAREAELRRISLQERAATEAAVQERKAMQEKLEKIIEAKEAAKQAAEKAVAELQLKQRELEIEFLQLAQNRAELLEKLAKMDEPEEEDTKQEENVKQEKDKPPDSSRPRRRRASSNRLSMFFSSSTLPRSPAARGLPQLAPIQTPAAAASLGSEPGRIVGVYEGSRDQAGTRDHVYSITEEATALEEGMNLPSSPPP